MENLTGVLRRSVRVLVVLSVLAGVVVSVAATRPEPAGASPMTCVYVLRQDGTVSVVDAATNTVTGSISVGGMPQRIATANGKAYVTDPQGGVPNAGKVQVINTYTSSVEATITGLNVPVGVLVAASGKVYVVNNTSASVSVIDPATNTVTKTIGVGPVPYGAAQAPNGKIYVTNNMGLSVSVIDPATDTVTNTITVGDHPVGVSVSSSGKVYVANNLSNTVSIIDSATDTVTGSITMTTRPQEVDVAPSGTLYVLSEPKFPVPGNTVSVIDTATNTVISTLSAVNAPAAAVSSTGTAYVLNISDQKMSVMNGATVTANVDLGGVPQDVAVGPGNCMPAEPSAPVGSGVASPAAVVNGTVSLSPSSGSSASTSFGVSLNGSSSCPGDGVAGYRWQTFLIDASVDLQTVQFDATGPVPSLPADSSKFSEALFDTSSVKVLAKTPSVGTGAITGIPTMSFVGNGAVPDGTYHLGVACTSGSAGTSQLKSLWSTVVTFSNSGANWNQNTEFTPVTPVRIYDTRPGFVGLRDVTKMRVGPATPLCVTISGVGGIPTTASAVAMNVVATDTAGPGFLTVYPGGVTRPVASSVNYVSSDITSNGVITALDSSGVACVYSMVPAHVVVDVTGWFPAGSSFTSVTPARVVDTRPGQPDGLRAVPKVKIGPTNTVEAQLTNLGPGGAIVPGTGVEAVALNVTVTESAGGGFVTVYACGTRPETSSVNFTAGQIIPNSVITQVSETGTICVHSSIDAHVIVDVVGWFSDTGTYTAVAPVRMADTRASEAAGLRPVNKVKIGPAITPTINFTNIGPLPASVRAVSLNVTVDGTTGPGFITAYPCGTRPPTSSLNYTAANMTKANAMIIPVSASGDMCIYSMTGTDIVVDLVGYFT